MSIAIQHKRGLKANLPASGAAGEFFVTTDTHEITIGTGAGTSPLKVDASNVTNLPAATQPVNAQTGTTYAIVGGDAGKLVTLSNASPVAVSIPQAGTGLFTSTFFVDLQNLGAGAVTITPTTSTINGAATFVLQKNQGIRLNSDGANYQVQTGMKPAKFTAVANQFLTSVDDSGNFSAAQPAFTNISGTLVEGQLPSTIDGVTGLATIDCGTF
jgi:hypothetical protein